MYKKCIQIQCSQTHIFSLHNSYHKSVVFPKHMYVNIQIPYIQTVIDKYEGFATCLEFNQENTA